MSESLATRASLLVRLRDPRDAGAWSQFVDVYGPLIYRFSRKQGLQDADAADLVQDVLRSVSQAIGRLEYDAKIGSFRGWLFTIARNRLRDSLQHSAHRQRGTGGTDFHRSLQEIATPGDEAQWNDDYEQQVFDWAARQVRLEVQDPTWQAFWKTAVEGRSGQDVAAELDLSISAVYLAKSRVMQRLRDKIATLHDDPPRTPPDA